MAWNDTFTETTDWSNVAFQNMFVDALNQRLAWVLETTGVGTLSPVAIGDDVQPYYAINPLLTPNSGNVIANIQGLVITYFFLFADKAISYTSPPASAASCGYTGPSFASATGLTWTGSILAFRRKCLREISSTTATADVWGNPAISGQIAWLLNAPDLYICTSSGGTWAIAPAGSVVDVLDSAAGNLAPGELIDGDYIGPWLFNEARDCLNAMFQVAIDQGGTPSRETSITPHAGFYYAPFNVMGADVDFGTITSFVSWSDAKSQLSAAWPQRTATAPSAIGVVYSGNNTTTTSVSEWRPQATNFKWSIGAARGFANPLTFKPKVYYIANASDPGVPLATNTFDPNGTTNSVGSPISVGPNLMAAMVVDQASCPVWSSGATLAYPLIGDFGTISSPPNPCSAPPTNGDAAQGFSIGACYIIEDYSADSSVYSIFT